MTTPLEAALGYAAFCGVLPCTARKTPIKIEGLFEHGFASATTRRRPSSRRRGRQYKAADIGLALPRGVLVVDVDVAKGKQGRDGFHPPLRLPAGGNGDGGEYDSARRLARLFPLRPVPSTCPDHDHVEPRCPHRRLGLRHRAFARQRSALDSATLIDAAHGGAAMALGAAEKAA